MKNAVFQFEVKAWLKTSLFYVLIGSPFLFTSLGMLGTGGFFDGPTDSNQNIKLLNSPFALASVSFLFVKLLLFSTAVFGGFSLYKDYRNKTHHILYSFPISKSYYLNGKFTSVLLLLFIACFTTVLGIYVGEQLLGLANPKIGSFKFLGYLLALGLYVTPTIMVMGTFVFVVIGITRNIFSAFIVVMCFILLQLILENLLFNKPDWLALLDPFGQNAFQQATQHWSFELQNSAKIPVSLLVILNRILWIFLAGVSYIFFFKKFDFQYDLIFQIRNSYSTKEHTKGRKKTQVDFSSVIRYDFSLGARFKHLLFIVVYDFKSIVRYWMFIMLNTFGGMAVFFIQLKVSNTGELNMFPLTRILLGAPLSIYTLVIIFGTFMFSGLLVNKARQYKMNLLVNATPVLNWQLMLSKIGAISLAQIVQLLIFLAVSLAIQLLNNYKDFELSLYFFHLFALIFPTLLIWNLISHFVHTLFPNIFLGFFVLACLWIWPQALEQLGINAHLLKFNNFPALTYSGFQGYGYRLQGYFYLLVYWLLFGLLMACMTALFWKRESVFSLKERLMIASSRLAPLNYLPIIILVVSFLWFAFKIYDAELQDEKRFPTGNQMDLWLKDYKEEWGQFSELIQPKITDIDLVLHIYPENESFDANGTYKLVNSSECVIDTIMIRTGFDEITKLNLEGKAKLLKSDSIMKSHLYQLFIPLQPNDSLTFSFSITNTLNTTFARNSNVLSEGTYLKQDILPRLGYQFVEHEWPLSYSLAKNYNYFHRDADYVNIHTTISTAKDQIAIAPGELITQKTIGDRSLYAYDSPKPIKFNFSFHSAKYEIIEEFYDELSIQFYCKKGHGYNSKFMIDGLKAALDYNTKWFGKYPYDQVRIIEFPLTEDSYTATLTANNIPTSEILFGVNTEQMKEKFNLPFYVIAHELTHEWFGNQLMPADNEGAKMLTESITEYLTLYIYREHFGEELANQFLEIQRRRYLEGRIREREAEKPLHKVLSHQEYIAYGKGAIAFNEIAKVIGLNKMNMILQGFVKKYTKQIHLYPTTLDFIQFLKEHTKEENHVLIDYWLLELHDLD